MTGDFNLQGLQEVKGALKDLLENADITKSQRKKIEDLLSCETESGLKCLATKYSIGISCDEDNVYVTFFGKNEEFEKPKAEIGRKTPWKRFFPQSSQPTEKRQSGSRSFDDLIAQLETVDPSTIEIEDASPEDAFDSLINQLREQGVRFTKPLINAIKHTSYHRELIRSETWLQDLIDFLQANRDFLEKVYSSGRFLPPFSIDFYDVSDALQRLALRMMMANGVRDPGKYIFVSPESWRTQIVVILLPVTNNEFHLIAATVHRRRWYSPPSKAEEHLRGFNNAVKRALKAFPAEVRKRIRSTTYIMLGRYTRNVRGGLKRIGMHPAKRAVLVFRDKRWIQHVYTFLKNLYSRRLGWLRKRIKGEPYGEIKQMYDAFRAFVEALSLSAPKSL